MSHERIRSDDPIEGEIDAFMAKLPEMLKEHEGKWTIFVDGESLGFWDSPSNAMSDPGASRATGPGLLRKVSREYEEHGRYGRTVHIPTPLSVRHIE